MTIVGREPARLACLCLLGVIVLPACVSCLPLGPGRGTVPLAFRYDDFSAKSDTALEQEIFDLFERAGVPLTIGVIPDVCEGPFEQTTPQNLLPLTDAKAAMLRDRIAAGNTEVAQHGYTHQAQTPGAADPSEFRGLSYQDQRDRIAAGKTILEQAIDGTVAVLIPPWDRYDANTVTALEDLGFACLSAGQTGVQPEGATLMFVPATCKLDSVEQEVNKIRLVPDGRPIVVLLHATDFHEDQPQGGPMSLADLKRILVWVKSQPMLRLETVGQIATGQAAAQSR